MSTNSSNAAVGVAGRKVEELIRRFEDSWRTGSPISIEVLLEGVEAEVRQAALPRLSAVEASRRGTSPPPGTTVTEDENRKQLVDAETALDRMVRETVELTEALPRPSEEQSTATASTRYIQMRFFKAGGLGELYQARDQSLERDVALKFLGKAVLNNSFLRQKFEVEAIVTGGLDHPGVVPVYGLGETWDGRPFYAMRFIEGDELQDKIDRLHADGLSRMGLHRLIGSLIAVCRTVAYAHSRGVIHRDIKPENVKIGKFGETILLDWGLAQTIQRDADSRARGLPSLVQGERKASAGSDGGGGTIGYMSPEQLGDQPATPSAATDVYSLGATLYHILTGRPSIVGANCSAIRLRIVAGDFPKPSKICPLVPKALEAICLKAMARDAADRYPDASELADDLQAWMADESVSCYREPLGERAVRHLRRHRVVAGAIAVSAALVIAGLVVFAGVAGNKAEQERVAHEQAEQALSIAESAREGGMRVAARLAAKAVASDIELRWRILESRADDPDFRQMLTDATGKLVGSPEQVKLQNWLAATRRQEPIASASWCLYDAEGVQLARDADDGDRSTIGQSFRFRDYFHGVGRDLAGEEAATARALRHVYRSSTFVSTANGGLTVAFSAPVWKSADRSGEPIGVIMMSMSVGSYRGLLEGMNAGQTAALVDVRDDRLDTVTQNGKKAPVVRSGLVLHHPKLKDWTRHRLEHGELPTIRVSEEDVVKFRKLQDTGLTAIRHAVETVAVVDSYRTDYVDPVANPDRRPVRAAVEPILVRTRQGEAINPDWVVIVHDVVEAPASPNP